MAFSRSGRRANGATEPTGEHLCLDSGQFGLVPASLNPDGSEMVSLVSLEGLVLMKLLACVDDPARLQDRGDIIALLRIHSERVDRDWVLHTARQIEPGYAKAFAAIAAIADAGELGPTGGGTSVL